MIQNCNLAEGDNLKAMTDGVLSQENPEGLGLKDVKSLELIDFQCNDLNDKHTGPLISMLTS